MFPQISQCDLYPSHLGIGADIREHMIMGSIEAFDLVKALRRFRQRAEAWAAVGLGLQDALWVYDIYLTSVRSFTCLFFLCA